MYFLLKASQNLISISRSSSSLNLISQSYWYFTNKKCKKKPKKNLTNSRLLVRYLTLNQKKEKTEKETWVNVEITLIRRWKCSKIQRWVFNVAQLWHNFSTRCWNNFKTTLHNIGTTLIRRCFNLASTLVKAILNPMVLVMIVDCEIVEYMLNKWIVFILLNEKTIFYFILTIQLLIKYQKIF